MSKYKVGDKIIMLPEGEWRYLCDGDIGDLQQQHGYLIVRKVDICNSRRDNRCTKRDCNFGYRFVGDDEFLGEHHYYCFIENHSIKRSILIKPKKFTLK